MIIKSINRDKYENEYRNIFKSGSGIIIFTASKEDIASINADIWHVLDYSVKQYMKCKTPIIAINPYENRDLVKEFGVTQNSSKWPFEVIIDHGTVKRINMPMYYMTIAMDYDSIETNRRREIESKWK